MNNNLIGRSIFRFTFTGVVLAFLISPQASLGQSWAPVGTTWHYKYADWFEQCPLPYTKTYIKYYVSKDTVVNSQNCQIIVGQIIGDYYSIGQIDTIDGGTEIMYGDSQYVFVYRNNKFYKVFDFSASIGDTITVIDTAFDGFFFDKSIQYNLFEYIIDSISTIVVGSDTLKKFHVTNMNDADWVIDTMHFILSGVGVDGWFLNGFLGRPRISSSEQIGHGPLRCFNNTVISYNFMGIPCDTICLDPNPIGIESKGTLIKGFDVFPIPSTDVIYLDVPPVIDKQGLEISIINALGQKIESGESLVDIYNSSINISTLPHGIYYLVVKSNDHLLYSRNFIKQ